MTNSPVHRLFRSSPGRPEDDIKTDVVRLLDGLQIESVVSYRTQGGPADIFLPNRRVFIETKAVGLADDPHSPQARENSETAFQQLERYLRAEMNDELARLPLDEQPDLPWTAVLTDGRVWHAWKFPHSDHSIPLRVLDSFRPLDEDELLRTIEPIVNLEPVGKPWVPADPAYLFIGALDDLRAIHAQLTGQRLHTTDTKLRLWLDMLRGSGMAPESMPAQIHLFTAHCFLVALARGVVHTLLNPSQKPDPSELLGNGYLSWIVEIEDGRVWAQGLLDKIHFYEWRRTAGDVLRPLYERFVDQSDRRDFGEVYTPDWLAEMMVEEVLDEDWCNESVTTALVEMRGQGKMDGIGVLDPTCGSGTFLYHSAKRILASQTAERLQPGQLADVVCRLVNGIDIHPVAVEFSRATLLRALPATPSAGDTALRIFQGDALMMREADKNTLFAPRDGEILIRSPQGREILIPRTFSEHVEFSDMIRRMVDAAVRGVPLPVDIGLAMGDDESKIASCHNALTEVVQNEGNSVWAWYITNVLGPERLARRKINRIVANPPWVKLSNIQVLERKRALERLAGKDNQSGNLGIWTGGRQAPHFDIAQLFLCHARKSYLSQPDLDPCAWVTKASLIKGGNWERFRDWHLRFQSQIIDFSSVRVFGGGDARRSCVVFEVRRSSLAADSNDSIVLKARCIDSTPDASMRWESAQSFLRWETPRRYPPAPSDYISDSWRQGATIVPKVLTRVETNRSRLCPNMEKVTTVKSDKRPWEAVRPRTGELPTHWLVPLLTSKQLLPFGFAPTGIETGIVPCDESGYFLDEQQARQTGLWAELDDLYRERRGGGSNTPQDLIARINYAGMLSVQLPLRSQTGSVVVYPTSGDVMRAARLRAGNAVVESKVYWRKMGSVNEARYVIALLNAPSLEKAFRNCRQSGRDFHKHPWRSVPIVAYNKINDIHRKLASLAARAENTVREMDLPEGQVAASRRIRERLTEDGLFDEIDSLVKKLLPKHVD